MRPQRIIGCDLDGCLANFNDGARRRIEEVTGDLRIPEGFEPQMWNYFEAYGYSKQDVHALWESIKADPTFWLDLKPLDGARRFLKGLEFMAVQGEDEVYFLTTRPGRTAKMQSEIWLRQNKWKLLVDTVLIDRGGKGYMARALGLTHFLDDRYENCQDVRDFSPTTKVFLLDRAYNRGLARHDSGIHTVTTLDGFLTALEDTD